MKPSQKKLKAAQYLTKIEDDIIEIMNEKEQQSKDTAPSRGTTRQSENTKSEMTKSIKKERKDATRNIKKMVKKQETVKKAKKSVKNFLDDEAGEGFESEEEKDQQKRGSKNEVERYSNEFLRAKTERLNNSMVDDMMKKYQDVEEEEDNESQIAEK